MLDSTLCQVVVRDVNNYKKDINVKNQYDEGKEICSGDSVYCPVQHTISIIQGKWTLIILRDLMGGKRRFGELRKSAGGISPKTLSVRLKELEDAGILSRTVFAEVPPRVEYEMTDKGRELGGMIEIMATWGAKWKQDHMPKSRKPRIETVRMVSA
jgi:DNA-binding HxlR family transcriptional regulator